MSTEFIDFCRARGVQINEMPPLGVWKRYRTDDKPTSRNGAIKFMGDHAFVQNHATMTEIETWHADKDAPAYIQSPEMQARIEAAKADSRRRSIEGMAGARMMWNRSTRLLGGHPYLSRKGLSMVGCTGLRVYDGQLVIPVLNGEYIISTQSIHEDGTKRFFVGAPVKSGAYIITRQGAAVTCVVEGLATGLAIYQAIPQAQVIVAFDAGNMLPVVQRIMPKGSVVVCGDNDHGTQAKRGFNPGLEKAANVAEFLGCGMAAPTGIEGSDWADYMKEFGIGAHKKIAREVLQHARYVC